MVIPANKGKRVVQALIRAIVTNRDYLSQVDGLIGDGDHGVNMSKGFEMAGKRLTEDSFEKAFETLGLTLLDDIGGSMGPLYGSLFLGMSGVDTMDGVSKETFGEMLLAAQREVEAISPARPGDKTLMDVLVPAVKAYREAISVGKDFSDCLRLMKQAAETGRDSTRDMVAKIGRASRLGERSRGVLDAGAASCCIVLTVIAGELNQILMEG